MLQPVTIFCVAAPEDSSVLAQWEKHLLPLQRAGYISVWSERHLQAGEPRNVQIKRYVERADLILLLLSSDFFDSGECIYLMQQALQRAQQGLVRVIPVLVRFVAWQDTDLGTLSPLPANGRPITSWEDRDEAFQSCIDTLKQLIAGTIPPEQDRDYSQVQTPARKTRYYSCFISYAHQDEPFAKSLYQDLVVRGVPCWLAPHDLQVGAPLRQSIDDTIHKHEKLLLILSKHSIESVWTEDEVEAAMEYERKEQRKMLLPISIDTSFQNANVAWVRKIRRSIYIGDFTEQSTYPKVFEQLLRALTVNERE